MTTDSAEAAFTQSDKHALDDLKLMPWTPERLIAAQNMGLTLIGLSGEAWEEFIRTDIYPGALKDTCISIWLCTLPEDDRARNVLPESERNTMTVEEADASPKMAYRLAKKWAATRDIASGNSKAFWQAYSKFLQMMNEVSASSVKPEPQEGDEDESPND